MKAFVVEQYGKDGLRAAGINPLDKMVRNGEFKQLLKYRTPFVHGHDVAGVVTRVGSAVRDFLLRTEDNPHGVHGQVFEDIKSAILQDRYAYFEDFFNSFYNVDVLGGSRISDRAWQASFNVAVGASPFATYACVDSWLTDFCDDLARIDVPTLVMHGTEDRILPLESTAARLPDLIGDVRLVRVVGEPHNITWTHPDEVNTALLGFLAA